MRGQDVGSPKSPGRLEGTPNATMLGPPPEGFTSCFICRSQIEKGQRDREMPAHAWAGLPSLSLVPCPSRGPPAASSRSQAGSPEAWLPGCSRAPGPSGQERTGLAKAAAEPRGELGRQQRWARRPRAESARLPGCEVRSKKRHLSFLGKDSPSPTSVSGTPSETVIQFLHPAGVFSQVRGGRSGEGRVWVPAGRGWARRAAPVLGFSCSLGRETGARVGCPRGAQTEVRERQGLLCPRPSGTRIDGLCVSGSGLLGTRSQVCLPGGGLPALQPSPRSQQCSQAVTSPLQDLSP